MKVDFQCGDFITIPEGCKAIIKGGSVVFEKEEQEFKDGDVLCSLYNSTMLIFKEEYKDHSNRFYTRYNTNHSSNEKWNKDAFRLATEEEKKLLFDKMKEQGLKWNAEEKRVEKIRWRAKRGEYYFLFRSTTLKVDCYTECFDEIDANLYYSDNYFRTNEQAEEAAKRVKEVLHKYHEEIGE
nr:MAG TPA: hypothetical protein [Caudoviricetes sp.]